MTRNGKIARLPRVIREELNQHLRNGEEGKKLLARLNELPDVRAILTADFNGKPVREQNLSEWRKGGYQDWLSHQEALEAVKNIAEHATDWDSENVAPLTDTLAFWVASRYAVKMRRSIEAKGTESWRLLRQMCADVVELRRGDHSAQRLLLERQRTAAQTLDAQQKWKRKLVVGLDALAKYVEKHPKAQAAFDELVRQVRHPFDPRENPTQPDPIT